MGMGIVRTVFFCVFLLGAQLFAQSGTNRPAGTASIFEASAGYVYMSMTAPSTPRMTLNGIDANGIVQFTPRWGGMLDFTFVRGGNVAGTGHSDRVFSGLIGPMFYLMDGEKTRVFLHALIGTAAVDSAVPITSTSYFKGYETRFSYALGGGVEHNVRGPFALRLTAGYQRTSFVNSTLALERQNNLRLTTSLVYRFGNR